MSGVAEHMGNTSNYNNDTTTNNDKDNDNNLYFLRLVQ